MDGQLDIETLYIDYHIDIYQFSLYFSSNKQDAEDITQDTFLKAIGKLPSLQDPSRAKYWLLSIARNTAIDHMRRKKLKSLFPSYTEKGIEDSLDDHILFKEKWQEIQKALLKIKPHYRSLLILRGIQELTIKETAEILQCTELKVRVDFHRAGKLLKKEMGLLKGVGESEENRNFN